MALYETLPSDFSNDRITHLEIRSSEISNTGAATHYEVTDTKTDATFFIIQRNPRVREQSDYFRVIQLTGAQRIFSPATIETRGYSRDPSHLAQRAILTAMQEFELAVNRLR